MLGATRRVTALIPRRLQPLRELHEDIEESIHFHKTKGQHILTNPRILDTIVRKSAINPTDTVLEIGPGTGNLTLKLLEASHEVIAIEIDHRMVNILENRTHKRGLRNKLRLITKDALRTEFPPFDLVVANIPYSISSPLLIKLLYGTTPFRSATLLLQKEFARRLLANPGDSEFNRLAVNVKLLADVEFVMDVSKRDFLPPPKVDSSVVIIRPKAKIPTVDLHQWRAFTRTCFNNKNKTLGATFKSKRKVFELLELNNASGLIRQQDDFCSLKEKIIGVLREGGFDDKRPSKLSIEELLHLMSLFNQVGVYFDHHGEVGNEDDRFEVDDVDD
ncbi:ribosomal RNA small subunit methyltransferase, mitochondrial [Trifolium pratense]|uniref:ribosomal RNA small subunit methyltransferase, mitochondrial n=1 Tax=Trifolium pratense TaxID=57577 RepID=UPI001E69768F|nr:ribosomal RNA small subunit methyltransferase, mitochondrial [Trifolium pratense]XP_045817444.1 ribosomal RNA small subunit methyltransferase, mitochondrial [Trifolium pratense]